MSGTTIPLFSRRTFDYDDLGGSGTSEIQIVKAVDVSQYTSGTASARAQQTIGGGGNITVNAYTTAPTAEVC
jgi:hypothetical protein